MKETGDRRQWAVDDEQWIVPCALFPVSCFLSPDCAIPTTVRRNLFW